jgi:S1-C subfamily serine protease
MHRMHALHPTALAALALAGAGAAAMPAPAPQWVPAGEPGAQMQYYIDAGTVRQQGEVTHYRLVGRGVREESRQTTVEAEVGVHCGERRRVEYVTTTRWNGGVRTGTGSAMQEVAAGSRMAAEVEVACQLARGGGPQPDTHAAAAPAAAVQPVRYAPALPQAGLKWSGTGFAVSRDTVVTNSHVVRGCPNVQVMQGEQSFPARVVASDSENDLAALSVPGMRLQPLEIAPARQELGESITVLGYPLANVLGADLRVTTGIVSALRGIGGEERTMQISAPVQSGNSGGPVLDQFGAVAGVVVKKLDTRLGAENVSFAVQLQPLRSFLASNAVAYTSAREAQPARLPTVAQVVRKTAPSVLLVMCA